MKTLKLLGLAVAVLMGSGLALADGIDPIVVPSRGPTGSPPYSSTLSLGVANQGVNTDDFTVQNGTVQQISITLPAVDTALGVTCGVSNAFLDGGVYNPQLHGFAPVINSDGSATCNWFTFSGTNNEPAGSESVLQMELDCLATNLGIISDADDCAGVPSGTNQSDVVFTITNAVVGVPLTANSVISPEPQAAAMLLLGLGSLVLFAYRRKQLV